MPADEDGEYKLCKKFLAEYLAIPESMFEHSLDCLYLNNYTSAESRGGHYHFRPSYCTKFILKTALPHFDDMAYYNAYFGASADEVANIVKSGHIPAAPGCLGTGLYSSPSPLYAQLWSKAKEWHGYYVQTMLNLRILCQDGTKCLFDKDQKLLTMCNGADFGAVLEWLHEGKVPRGSMLTMTKEPDKAILHGVLVKFHKIHPHADSGEYDTLINYYREHCHAHS